jgi:hypothetical protein
LFLDPFNQVSVNFNWDVVVDVAVPGDSCQHQVPLLKQAADPWGEKPYDHPAAPNPSEKIKKWGCALTSLVMALNFAGVSTNPLELNTLLNDLTLANPNEPGWNAAGGVHWWNAVRASSAGTRKYLSVDKSDASTLQGLVCAGHPVIVRVPRPGNPQKDHFVLVTGESQGDFLINDPGYQRFRLSEYGGQFTIRGWIAETVPAQLVSMLSKDAGRQGDLFVVVDGVQVVVTDDLGQWTGLDPSTQQEVEGIPNSIFYRESIGADDESLDALPETQTVGVGAPTDGRYLIAVRGTEPRLVTILVSGTDTNGQPKDSMAVRAIVGAGVSLDFALQFQGAPGSVSSIERLTTFNSLRVGVDAGRVLELIDSNRLARALGSIVEAAERAAEANRPRLAKALLGVFKAAVRVQTPRHIDAILSEVLIEDANALISQLP